MKSYYITAILLTILTINVVALGFMVSGTPFQAVKGQNDNIRIGNLRSMSTAVESYYNANKRLPQSISLTGASHLNKDPKTGKGYEYIITGLHSYQLCAVFETDSSGNKSLYAPPSNSNEPSHHIIGRQCFSYSVNPYKNPEPNNNPSSNNPQPTDNSYYSNTLRYGSVSGKVSSIAKNTQTQNVTSFIVAGTTGSANMNVNILVSTKTVIYDRVNGNLDQASTTSISYEDEVFVSYTYHTTSPTIKYANTIYRTPRKKI